MFKSAYPHWPASGDFAFRQSLHCLHKQREYDLAQCSSWRLVRRLPFQLKDGGQHEQFFKSPYCYRCRCVRNRCFCTRCNRRRGLAIMDDGWQPYDGPGRDGAGHDGPIWLRQHDGIRHGPRQWRLHDVWNRRQAMAPISTGDLHFSRPNSRSPKRSPATWNTYADALRANSDSMLSMHQQMMGQFQSDDRSATSFLDFQIAAMRSRLDALEKLKPAMTALYDALSKDQKEKADSVLPMMGCI